MDAYPIETIACVYHLAKLSDLPMVDAAEILGQGTARFSRCARTFIDEKDDNTSGSTYFVEPEDYT